MKKILLIDDRGNEQATLLNQHEINLDIYRNILDNLCQEDLEVFLDKLNREDDSLLEYQVWIIHEGLFKKFKKIKGLRKKVEKFCRQNAIELVFFTGVTPTIMYDQKKGLLKLSRNDLYKNLKTFLEYGKKDELRLEILGFGSNWEVSLLSNVEDSIERFLYNVGETIDMEVLKSEINNLDSAIKILGNDRFFNLSGNVDRNVIESMLQDMQNIINEQMGM